MVFSIILFQKFLWNFLMELISYLKRFEHKYASSNKFVICIRHQHLIVPAIAIDQSEPYLFRNFCSCRNITKILKWIP